MARTATRPSASWSAPSGTSASSATPPTATTPGCSSSISTTSLIAKNSGKGNRIGIELTGGQFGSSGNRLTGNTANRNDESGIIVDDDKPENLSKITLKGNTANKNQIHGIEGLAGVVDGGGNRASGNATPPQCIGVVCSG